MGIQPFRVVVRQQAQTSKDRSQVDWAIAPAVDPNVKASGGAFVAAMRMTEEMDSTLPLARPNPHGVMAENQSLSGNRDLCDLMRGRPWKLKCRVVVVVAHEQMLLPVEPAEDFAQPNQPAMVRKIADMPHGVVWPHNGIPIADQRLVHVRHRSEGPIAEFYYSLMSEVGISGKK
jgi:hypothetical protein